jgi:hypothetical protein
MSIILRALKKIQEQEAGQSLASPSAEMPADEKKASTASFFPHTAETERPQMAAPPAVPRHSFGFGLMAVLGLLVILGIATTGWFANRIYLNLQTGPEIASEAPREEMPAIAEEPARHAEAVAPLPVPGEPETLEAVPVSAPAVAEEPGAPQPEPPIAAATSEPQISSASLAQPVQPAPAPPPIVIEVPVVESSEPTPSVPVMKEARPAKAGRPEFKINAIAWKNKEPRAIVNMQSIYEGDVIEGATVVSIKRKIVVFEYEGEIFEVRF